MRKHLVGFVSFVVMAGCYGEVDSGDIEAQAGAASTGKLTTQSASWDPRFSLSPNNNSWWLEVVTGDARTAGVWVLTPQGREVELQPTAWGSFAVSELFQRNTVMRLVFLRNDGVRVSTHYFQYIDELPTLQDSWAPTLELARGSNEGMVEVAALDDRVVQVEVLRNGATWLDVPEVGQGTFAGAATLPYGTVIVLRATSAAGAEATTTAFAYAGPTVPQSGEPVPATSPWDPGISYGSASTRRVEFAVEDTRTTNLVLLRANRPSIELQKRGSLFFARRTLQRGALVTLSATRADGVAALTLPFRYLVTDPQMDHGEPTPEPTPVPQPQPQPEPQPNPRTATYTVSGSKILDPCGDEVLLRGVNKMFVWTDPNGQSLPEIAKSGANTVRIVWDTSGSPAALRSLIEKTRNNGLLPMVELHDATGDLSGVPALVSWWVRSDVVASIEANESALLVNIANEAGDWNVTPAAWVSTYTTAITRMRAAGIRTPLVIDSRGWGHDVDLILSHGPSLLAADPLHNIIFSTHQYYGVNDIPANYYDATFGQAAAKGLALVVGEFGDAAWDCVTPVDYRKLIAAAAVHRVGWYAWSWGPGNSPCSSLDMTTNGTHATLRGWGLEVASTHPSSIKNTAKPVRVSSSPTCQ